MTDLYIHRYQILVVTIVIIVVALIIFSVLNWMRSVKSSFRIKEGMPVITFDQPGIKVLNQLQTLQKSQDFKENYSGVIFEENVYDEDELGNQSTSYRKVFTLDKEKLMKLNIDRLIQKFNGNYNDVVVYIATELSEVRFEEV